MKPSVASDTAAVRRTDSLDACTGVRELDTRLAGICLICDRSWSKSEGAIAPAAAKGEREIWFCPNFVQVQS